MLKITIIYDNTTVSNDLEPDWGFAAYIETDDKTILFDSGSDGHILLNNMKKLNLDPKKVDMVFISHHHFDHTGGLAAFLYENPDVDVYVPKSLRGVRRAKSVTHIDEPLSISEQIYSTGELKGVEQSMVIKTPKGSVVIAGCSHPGLKNIIHAAKEHGKIHLLLGGFHGFDQFDVMKEVEWVCPTHCTRHINEIAERFPEKYIQGGAGRCVKIPIANNQ